MILCFHSFYPWPCALVFAWVCLNSTNPRPTKKKKKRNLEGTKNRGAVALMRDEINCAISLHVYPIEVYFSEDEGQCDSNSVYIIRSDRVFYIGFPVSHWL